MKRVVRLACLLAVAACTEPAVVDHTPSPTVEPEPRARITAVDGDVKVKLASSARYAAATLHLKLHENDKVLTGSDGNATITFANGQVVLLTPESLVAIQKPEAAPIKSKQPRTMDGISVESGRVEVEIDPAVSGSLFRIKTPDAEGIVPMREMEVVGGG